MEEVTLQRNRPICEVERAAKRLKPTDRSLLVQRFDEIGLRFMNRKPGGSGKTLEARWRSHFGASSLICADVWEMLEPPSLPAGSKLEHLLWALLLLKTYQTEAVCCSLAGGIDEQTWRERTWFFVDAVSQLESDVVSTIYLDVFDHACKCVLTSLFSRARSTLKSVGRGTKATIACSPSMELIVLSR